jgi:hypothetical protein
LRNLAKTIDKILNIYPNLEDQLLPIKLLWVKNHRNLYWEKLLNVLNSKIDINDSRRLQIQNVLNPKKRIPKILNTFEPPTPLETIIGVIPENIGSQLRKYDRLQVSYAKITIEAKMTHNRAMLIDVMKKTEKLEIAQKKLWMEVKDHFNLWDVDNPSSFFIRSQGPVLVLTTIKLGGQGRGPGGIPHDPSEGFFIKMDGDTLKKFFRYINTPLPPGISPESEQ